VGNQQKQARKIRPDKSQSKHERRRYVPAKHRLTFAWLHGVTSDKAERFIATVFKTSSNLNIILLRVVTPPIHAFTAKIYIVACTDPLLGSDRETNNEKTPSARQQIFDKKQFYYNRGTVFFTRSVPICYKQDSWSSESVLGYLKPVRTSPEDIVMICYQETTSEDRRLYMCCIYSDIWNV
jgi:hypothetical protein